MRSLNAERKPRAKARAQTPRSSSRRELPSVQPGTARRQKEPGVFSRWCRAYEEAGAPYTVV